MSITITLPTFDFKPLTNKIRRNAPAIGGAIALSGLCYYAWTQTNISYYMGLSAQKKFYTDKEVCEMKEKQDKALKDLENTNRAQVEETTFRLNAAEQAQREQAARHEEEARASRLRIEEAFEDFDLTQEKERAIRDAQQRDIDRYLKEIEEYNAGIAEWRQKLGDLLEDKEEDEPKLIHIGVARSDHRLDVNVGVGVNEDLIREAFGRAEKEKRVKVVMDDIIGEDMAETRDIVEAVTKLSKNQKKKAKRASEKGDARAAQPMASGSKLPLDQGSKSGGEASHSKPAVAPKGKAKAVDPPGKGDNYYKKPQQPKSTAADLFAKVESSLPGFKEPTQEELKNPAKYTKVTEHLHAKVNLYRRQRIRQLGNPKKVHEPTGLPFVPKLHRDALEAECMFFKRVGYLPYGFENMSVDPADADLYKQDVTYGLTNARTAHTRQYRPQDTKRPTTGPAPAAREDAPFVAPYPFKMGSAAYLQAFGHGDSMGSTDWDAFGDDGLGPLPWQGRPSAIPVVGTSLPPYAGYKLTEESDRDPETGLTKQQTEALMARDARAQAEEAVDKLPEQQEIRPSREADLMHIPALVDEALRRRERKEGGKGQARCASR